VRESNVAGQSFYEKLGFREVGRRRGYYSRPREDALILVPELTPVR
jgi:ribosomal-protein-alanine N-acetyltransferase